MRLGKYTLLRKIATGGMAEIFLARQDGPAGFQKILVIKRILPHFSSDARFVTMFLNEARLAALLNHPNVVSIFDLGEEHGSYYLAMEYIHGRSLDQILERCAEQGRSVPLEVVARIVADACVGLDYAHRFSAPDGTPLNLVHRDVSPQNILVTFDGLVKVVDFGVAKAATNAGKTETGAVKGKYAYMSPEQIAGAPLDRRSDVFALGVVLFELATGKRPFGDKSDLLAITAILNEAPQRPEDIRPGFPGSLETVIMRALEKERDKRYPDAQAMQRDLERFIRSEGKYLSSRELSAFVHDLFGDEATNNLALKAAELSALAELDATDAGGDGTHATPSPAAEAAAAVPDDDDDVQATAIVAAVARNAGPRPGSQRGDDPLAATADPAEGAARGDDPGLLPATRSVPAISAPATPEAEPAKPRKRVRIRRVEPSPLPEPAAAAPAASVDPARQAPTQPLRPPERPRPSPDDSEDEGSGGSGAMIAVIVVVALLGVGALGGGGYLLYRMLGGDDAGGRDPGSGQARGGETGDPVGGGGGAGASADVAAGGTTGGAAGGTGGGATAGTGGAATAGTGGSATAGTGGAATAGAGGAASAGTGAGATAGAGGAKPDRPGTTGAGSGQAGTGGSQAAPDQPKGGSAAAGGGTGRKPAGGGGRKPPPKPRRKTYGKLLIQTEPRAVVYIDGKRIGTMPIPGQKVTTGTHRIKVVWPDDAPPLKRRVRVSKGDVINLPLFR